MNLNLLTDFFSILFPDLCAACGNSLWKYESVVCTKCDFHLPRTGFHLDAENPVTDIFAGRIRPSFATSFLYFNKGSHVQKLVHQLKYKGRKDVGFWLGRQAGNDFKTSLYLMDTDVLVPVPLHPKKQMQRGYNQSEEFAKGICDRFGVPVSINNLVRIKQTETQTRKSRFSRWENVNSIFRINDASLFENKHILLVDDVITTGSTIEACFRELEKIPGARISVASIAAAIR